MKPEEEMVLKVTKEIVIKYIEIGRLPLTSFDEAFKAVYSTVQETVKGLFFPKIETTLRKKSFLAGRWGLSCPFHRGNLRPQSLGP